MKFWVAIFLLAAASVCAAQSGAAAAAPTPVLVELFTSEGCSDCPPADALLAQLDQKQPVAGAQVIVLSEHVDYWNQQGWVDPFSSALFTHRQESYCGRFGLPSAYTPQMVVDGDAEFVGSDDKRADSAIARERSKAKLGVEISDLKREGKDLVFTLDAAAPRRGHADAFLVLAQNHATSRVRNGENAGRTLNHVAVVRVLTPVAELAPGNPAHKMVRVKLGALSSDRDLRLVIFVQERDAGRVLGATMKDLASLASSQ